MTTLNKRAVLAIVLLCGVFVFGLGCRSIVPGQPNSNCRDGEQVKITMLDRTNAAAVPEFVANYDAAHFLHKFEPTEGKFAPAAIAAPLVAAAVSGAVDYVAKAITNEAALYQAQFGDTLADDAFLIRGDGTTNYFQNYYGIKVERVAVSKHVRTNAFTLICGIGHTADNQLFVVKPLIFETRLAKAKVVEAGFFPSLVNWIFSVKGGNYLNSTADFKFDGYFKGTDQTLKVIPMGAFSFKFQSYDIASPKPLTVLNGGINPKQTSGFLDAAPISYEPPEGKPLHTTHAGNFTLTVNVTESDASNVKEHLEKLGQLVYQQKGVVITTITNKIEGK
jgi:hypothetical protein